MKYIIIIIILIIILLFLLNKKKQIEYRENYTPDECDFNCGKYKTDEDCLGCENCGLCSLTDNKGKKIKQCMPGTKKGSFFNQYCSGNNWLYYDDVKRQEIENSRKTNIVLTKVKEEVKQEELSAYDRILLTMGQRVRGKYSDIKPKQIFEMDLTPNKSEIPIKDNTEENKPIKPLFKPSEPILPPVLPTPTPSGIKKEPTTYDEVLLELESLSSF